MDRSGFAATLMLLALVACRSHAGESQIFHGPILVNQAGLDLHFTRPIEIEGESNRIRITLPGNLRPDYASMKIVDSTSGASIEFVADVYLSNGKVFTFTTQGSLPGAPGYPERVLELRPEDSARLTGKVDRIHLRSSRPAIIPQLEWQSWNQGM